MKGESWTSEHLTAEIHTGREMMGVLYLLHLLLCREGKVEAFL